MSGTLLVGERAARSHPELHRHAVHVALPDKPWWETVKVGDMMPLHVLRVIETKDRE